MLGARKDAWRTQAAWANKNALASREMKCKVHQQTIITGTDVPVKRSGEYVFPQRTFPEPDQ